MKPLKKSAGNFLHITRVILAFLALMQNFFGPTVQNARAEDDHGKRTRTPIKHVIVIVGENRTFDHIFATYNQRRVRA
jgi:phospholipase C